MERGMMDSLGTAASIFAFFAGAALLVLALK